MSWPRTLWRHLVVEISTYTLVGLVIFTLLVEVRAALQFVSDLGAVSVGGLEFLQLSAIVLPIYLTYALPSAVLFGVVVALGRMSSDGEIVALRVSGVRVLQLMPVVLLLGGVLAGISYYSQFELQPRSLRQLRLFVRELIEPSRVILPGRIREVGGNVIYVHELGDETCPLRGIWLSRTLDDGRLVHVTARCGRVARDTPDALTLTLTDGSIHFSQARLDAYRRIRFHEMETRVDIWGQLHPARRMRDYRIGKLRARIQSLAAIQSPSPETLDDLLDGRIELQRRLAIPLAPVVLALLGVGVGISPPRSGRSWGVLFALAILGGYWSLMAVGQIIAEAQLLPVVPAIWMANVVAGALAVVLLARLPRAES